MYVLNARIEIEEPSTGKIYKIDHVTSVRIRKSLHTIIDDCVVVMPKKLKWDGESRMPDFKDGKVRVYLGYNERLELAFVGYVRFVKVDFGIEIICESEISKYRYMTANYVTYEHKDFATILKDQGVTDELVTTMQDKPGLFTVDYGTVYGLMLKLKRLGIIIKERIEDEEVKISFGRYIPTIRIDHKYEFGRNIIKYKSDNEAKVEYLIGGKIIFIRSDGRREVVVDYGNQYASNVNTTFWGDGSYTSVYEDERYQHIHLCTNKIDFYKPAEITTFGAGMLQPMSRVTVNYNIGSIANEYRNYFTSEVTIDYGPKGLRQKAKLIRNGRYEQY